MSNNTSNFAFWAGDPEGWKADHSAPFRVGHNGSLVATSATITGTINAGSIIGSNRGFNIQTVTHSDMGYSLTETQFSMLGSDFGVNIRGSGVRAGWPGGDSLTWASRSWIQILNVSPGSDIRLKENIKYLDI